MSMGQLGEIGLFGVIALAVSFLGLSLYGALGVIERMHHRRRHDDEE